MTSDIFPSSTGFRSSPSSTRRADNFRRPALLRSRHTPRRCTKPTRLRLQLGVRSVPRNQRAAEAIVQANQANIDILADVFALKERTVQIPQIDVAAAHEQMVVLDTDLPVWGEPILDAS